MRYKTLYTANYSVFDEPCDSLGRIILIDCELWWLQGARHKSIMDKTQNTQFLYSLYLVQGHREAKACPGKLASKKQGTAWTGHEPISETHNPAFTLKVNLETPVSLTRLLFGYFV